MEVLYSLIVYFAEFGYIAVFLVLIACGFGVPIPEDIALIAGGVICGISAITKYPLNPHIMMIIALLGVLLGDSIMFSLGRSLGPKVTRIPMVRKIITPQTYLKIQEKAHRYGDKILFIARFLPGLRAPIFLTAGISHRVPLWKFVLMDGCAAIISVPAWVYLGYYFAYDLDKILYWLRRSEELIFGTIIVLVIVWVIYSKFYRNGKD